VGILANEAWQGGREEKLEEGFAKDKLGNKLGMLGTERRDGVEREGAGKLTTNYSQPRSQKSLTALAPGVTGISQ
jgi:hypothetical protein